MLSMNVRKKTPIISAVFAAESMMKNNQKKCVKSIKSSRAEVQ